MIRARLPSARAPDLNPSDTAIEVWNCLQDVARFLLRWLPPFTWSGVYYFVVCCVIYTVFISGIIIVATETTPTWTQTNQIGSIFVQGCVILGFTFHVYLENFTTRA